MPDGRRVGPRQVALAACAVCALAGTGRSAWQLATHPHRALLAYTLSAVAAVIYLGGLLLLAGADRSVRARRIAVAWCGLAFGGVLCTGTLALLSPGRFPDATVWSGYGSGYGYLPLILPVFATVWLYGIRTDRPEPIPSGSSGSPVNPTPARPQRHP